MSVANKGYFQKIRIVFDFFFFLSVVLATFMYLDVTLQINYLNFSSYHYVIFFIAVAVIISGYMIKNNKSILLIIFSISVAICMLFFKKEPEYISQTFLMIFSVLIFYSINEKTFKMMIVSFAVAALPFFIRWFKIAVIEGRYIGNRNPLNLSIMLALLIYINYESKGKKKLINYIIIFGAILICLIGESRTSILAWCLGFMLMLYFDVHKKLTKKKLILLFIAVIIALALLNIYQDAIIKILINKWGSSITAEKFFTFSGRTIIWADVLNNIEFWGLPMDYVVNKFGLANIHNGYIQSYVSFGVVPGLVYIFWNLIIIKHMINHRRNPKMQPLIIVFVPLLVINFFESIFILEFEYSLLGIIYAMLAGQISRISKYDRIIQKSN